MDTWHQVMPDYEIVCWNMNSLKMVSNIFVNEACSMKKWAFASDYMRLFALHSAGGIYLDCDVIVKKRFEDFLDWSQRAPLY
jgi:mannosyltransferase OCH1-like enzyme